MKNTMKKPVAIPVEKLRPFAGHPFKVKDDAEMNTLIESIQTQGILSPLLTRSTKGRDYRSPCLNLCPRPRYCRHCGGGQQPAPGAYFAIRKGFCV